MSKHPSTFLAREPVQVLVDQHVIVEAVLSRERCIADQTDEWLDTCNNNTARVLLIILLQKPQQLLPLYTLHKVTGIEVNSEVYFPKLQEYCPVPNTVY